MASSSMRIFGGVIRVPFIIMNTYIYIYVYISRWWFQIFFIFITIWGRFPVWLIFFRWVKTTNQIYIYIYYMNILFIYLPTVNPRVLVTPEVMTGEASSWWKGSPFTTQNLASKMKDDPKNVKMYVVKLQKMMWRWKAWQLKYIKYTIHSRNLA